MSLPEKLPPISTLPSLPPQTRAEILDLLFEPSPALHKLALPLTTSTSATTDTTTTTTTEPFASYDDLITAIGVSLNALADSPSSSDRQWLDTILAAHPRLGEKKVDSELSRAEQQAMAAASAAQGSSQDGESKAEAEELERLNRDYEAAFPGLRYVVFVAGRPRRVILEDMRTRIRRGDGEMERREAIKAMCDIASDRARKLQ